MGWGGCFFAFAPFRDEVLLFWRLLLLLRFLLRFLLLRFLLLLRYQSLPPPPFTPFLPLPRSAHS